MQCIFCKSDEINDLELGEMKIYKNIQVHYFCLLLSPSLLTNGEETDGILGFLTSDIEKESRRVARLKCHYCEQMGAGIGCCNSKCNRSFHLNCGLKNNCINQFTEPFLSFCHSHVEKRKENYSSDHLCLICYMKMGKYEKTKAIFTTCCKSEWFHKICLMRLADSAGYFFKCPKCNDKEIFTEQCMKSGIFIPQRDASWETEENAYQELMERPSECIADVCLCAHGRNSDKPSNELLICETCGSNCMHKKCWRRNEAYYCCFPVSLTTQDDTIDKISSTASAQLSRVNGLRSANLQAANVNQNCIESQVRKERKRNINENVDGNSKNMQKKRKLSNQIENEAMKKSAKISDFRSNFPIKRIRNGTFDELLFKPVVLLQMLTVEQLKMLSNVNNRKNTSETSKSDLFEFALISPSKKKSGKSFKNYTITSFFKPV